MQITVRAYQPSDLPDMIRIWNEVVEDGIAFPQEHFLDEQTGAEFFAKQTYSAVAEADGKVLVSDCLAQGKAHGFGILQFNAVVATNVHARHLYERLGFTQLGTIPKGFRMKDGHFEDICPYYHEL